MLVQGGILEKGLDDVVSSVYVQGIYRYCIQCNKQLIRYHPNPFLEFPCIQAIPNVIHISIIIQPISQFPAVFMVDVHWEKVGNQGRDCIMICIKYIFISCFFTKKILNYSSNLFSLFILWLLFIHSIVQKDFTHPMTTLKPQGQNSFASWILFYELSHYYWQFFWWKGGGG